MSQRREIFFKVRVSKKEKEDIRRLTEMAGMDASKVIRILMKIALENPSLINWNEYHDQTRWNQ